MAVLNWSTLSSGTYAFNPNVDVLRFDDSSISAADVTTTSSSGVADIVFSYHGKTVTLQTSSYTVTSTNVTFQNGSMLVIGDNTTGTANDDAANTVNGSGGADMLVGAGGNDTLNGGAGNDVFFIGRSQSTGFYGDDTLNGGDGIDTALYSVTNGYGVNVNLATGQADGGDANHPGSLITMNSIEAVVATPFDDNLTGSGANEFFFGRGGNDNIDGGGGNDTAIYSGTRAQYSITNNADGSITVTDTRGSTAAFDGVDTLRHVEFLQFSDTMVSVSVGGGTGNSLPQVTAHDASVHVGQSVAATSLFTVSQADNDPVTMYRFWDDGTDADSGFFTLNGVRQDAGVAIDVSAANVGNVRWNAGSVSGNETAWARASDSTGFGDWTSWTMTTGNSLPQVTAQDTSVHVGQSVAATSLFTVSQADSDPVTAYRFWDSGTDADSGFFTLNGVRQDAGMGIDVSAANVGNVRWNAGSVSGDETVWVQASDGFSFGDWTSWTMTTGNSLPQVTAQDTSVHVGQSVAATSLFTVSQADNDPVTMYRFWDDGTDADSGFFTLNGVRQDAGVAIDVSAANVGNVRWNAGSVSGNETAWARASDSTGFGDWTSWTMTTGNSLPQVTAQDTSVHVGQSVAATSLFTVSQADSDPVTAYRFWDSGTDADSGFFTLNGVRQDAGMGIDVSAANVGNVRWNAGSVSGDETAWVQASDSTGFGDWKSMTMTSANSAPQIAAQDRSVTVGGAVNATWLFQASDADGDAVTAYRFWDSGTDANSGYFTLNGVRQDAGAGIDVTAAQAANVLWHAGTQAGTELAWAQASDGNSFGSWKSVNMTTTLAT